MAIWSRFLLVGEERFMNGKGPSTFHLQLDKLDDNWIKPFSDLDYAIFSNGHWFFRTLYLYENNKQVKYKVNHS